MKSTLLALNALGQALREFEELEDGMKRAISDFQLASSEAGSTSSVGLRCDFFCFCFQSSSRVERR